MAAAAEESLMAYFGRRFKVKDPQSLVVDGIRFDSKLEVAHYRKLKMMEKAGEIRDVAYHTKYTFVVNGVEVGTYEADFTFMDKSTHQDEDGEASQVFWAPRVHDVKAWKTDKRNGKKKPILGPADTLRKNLMNACFGLEVEYV